MNQSEAIESLAAEIGSSDMDLYAFQPKGQKEKFFIGEAVITAAAVVLLTAFVKGLESTLQPRVQKWGEKLGTWIGEQLESLFKGSRGIDGGLDQAVAAVKTLVTAVPAEQRASAAEEVQSIVEDTLRKRGVPSDRAAAIAARTRQVGMELTEHQQ